VVRTAVVGAAVARKSEPLLPSGTTVVATAASSDVGGVGVVGDGRGGRGVVAPVVVGGGRNDLAVVRTRRRVVRLGDVLAVVVLALDRGRRGVVGRVRGVIDRRRRGVVVT
jgi:hypothetical protein